MIKHLDERNLERVTLQAVELTQRTLRELKRRSAKLRDLTDSELQALTGMISKMQRALATLLKEARGIQKSVADAVDAMSAEEQVNLIASLVALWPPERRNLLMEKVAHA